MDLTEVKCFLPESPVNIGDYANEGVTAAGLAIAVSNNRINASRESMLFITYDSLCQECNTTTGCKLKVSFPHNMNIQFICFIIIATKTNKQHKYVLTNS
jgi:hypothetical protein